MIGAIHYRFLFIGSYTWASYDTAHPLIREDVLSGECPLNTDSTVLGLSVHGYSGDNTSGASASLVSEDNLKVALLFDLVGFF